MNFKDYLELFSTQNDTLINGEEGALFNPEFKQHFQFTRDFLDFTNSHSIPKLDEWQYEKFLKQKAQKGIRDTYSAFMPFNESTRSIEPFIEIFKNDLLPGDIILNLWCRTGYTGEYLASHFPE